MDNEIKILKRLQPHPNVVKLRDIIETNRHVHVVMEHLDGSTIAQFVKRRMVDSHKVLEEAEAQRIFHQMADAVSWCHANRVCHRDLKLDNMMLTSDGTVKLIDFGLSARCDAKLFKKLGTPCYMAPEVIKCDDSKCNSYNGAKIDVWSLGVALFVLLTGSLPFIGSCESELARSILRGSPKLPEHVSADAKDLLKQMIAVSPEKRISIEGVRSHPWLKSQWSLWWSSLWRGR